jgi:GNAT superfamily N-acetyltransferase
MLRVRAIAEGEISSFIAAYADPAARARIGRYLADGETKPCWCFTADIFGGGAGDSGARRAALVYFRIDSESDELFVTDIDLPWEGDYLAVGKALLEESAAAVAAEGFARLELRLNDGDPHIEQLTAACKGAGYTLAQAKTRYVFEQFMESHNAIIDLKRLTYKSRLETGDAEFVAAIERVTKGSLDRVDLMDRQRLGAGTAARRYFDILKSIEDEPRRWFLAYDAEGKLAGLIVCQLLSAAAGCINYIGVVPECRGRGYSRELIQKATDTFRDFSGIKKIIADIDSENIPLAKNLALHGYTISGRFLVFEMNPASIYRSSKIS